MASAKCPKCGKSAPAKKHPTIPHILIVVCPEHGEVSASTKSEPESKEE